MTAFYGLCKNVNYICKLCLCEFFACFGDFTFHCHRLLLYSLNEIFGSCVGEYLCCDYVGYNKM